ncbi:MAG: hypothetical protein GVY19_12970 [Bacteroidetes bacterium]|jgi:VanZ family protein|nr:hypothetical protein [Bacteroidota bacterium]
MSGGRNILLFWKVMLWSLMMIILFTLPGSAFKSVKTFPHIDLVVHAAFYFIQTCLLIQAVLKYNRLNNKSLNILVWLLFPFIMGFTIETVQELFIANRYWDSMDVVANLAGLFMALGISRTRLFAILLPFEARSR